MFDTLLTIKKIAGILSVQERTIKNYIRDGKLKAVRVSHNVLRVYESDFNEFMDKRNKI